MRRALSVLVTASALVLISPALAGSAPHSEATADEPTLQTGFEQRDGDSWTTLQEEQAFLSALDSDSKRLSVSEIGRTAQGRPLQLIAVGDPAPRSPAEIADSSSVLFACSQHGDEPSGREACLQSARDLAASEDDETRALLRRTTVLFIPSANPDGTAANTRENSDDVDINRDHLELATAEAQAMARVIRDLEPDVLHDLHEYGPTPDVYDRQLIHLWPRNRNVDAQVYDRSVQLNNDYVSEQLRGHGYSTGIYGIHYGPNGEPIAQVAGDGQERILRNMSGLRHVLGILVEANNEPTTPAEQDDPAALNKRRVLTQKLAVQATFDMLREKRRGIAMATTGSAERAAAEGARGDAPFYFGGADNQLPTPDQVTTSPPCGYQLTPAQHTEIADALELHGIEAVPTGPSGPTGERYTVSMAQPAQPVIPLLMDERAQYDLVQAQPLSQCD